MICACTYNCCTSPVVTWLQFWGEAIGLQAQRFMTEILLPFLDVSWRLPVLVAFGTLGYQNKLCDLLFPPTIIEDYIRREGTLWLGLLLNVGLLSPQESGAKINQSKEQSLCFSEVSGWCLWKPMPDPYNIVDQHCLGEDSQMQWKREAQLRVDLAWSSTVRGCRITSMPDALSSWLYPGHYLIEL